MFKKQFHFTIPAPFPALITVLVLFLGLVPGCSDEDDPAKPANNDPTTGTVVVDPNPDSIDAPWVLSGPDSYHYDGSGDETLSGLAPGGYQVGWAAVIGWEAPTYGAGVLVAGDTLDFTCTYAQNQDPYGTFVYVPPGTFTMGSPAEEISHYPDEVLHPVTLTHGFFISKYEVTQQLWQDVVGGTTVYHPDHAKTSVRWGMAVAFCNALSTAEGLTPVYTINGDEEDVTWNQQADGYRLPTEAEWEYACRAGSQTALANGVLTVSGCELDDNLDAIGWYCGNGFVGVQDVALKAANAWGLYDMHGNVDEWCWDGYKSDYQNLPQIDPIWTSAPAGGRIVRGGSDAARAQYCRSASRRAQNPVYESGYYGMRVVRTVF